MSARLLEPDGDLPGESWIVDAEGPDNLFGVFEDEGSTGYLYLYDPGGRGIIDALEVYVCSHELRFLEDEVQVRWSSDGSKCGVFILNQLRAYFDLKLGKRIGCAFRSRLDAGIIDEIVLAEFA